MPLRLLKSGGKHSRPAFRHPERSEGSPECGTVLVPEILRCAPKDARHVERRETSPECSTVLIPEIPHYVRDDGYIGITGKTNPLFSTSLCYTPQPL
ncbi:hypothetical protein BN59_01684 [Legionella massiliensis]|uniref:Uncharacterized protein n=1 Tax=Legionella massiliensis TaxID=1034943 RepID=A0A078KWP6_9GAMM|nr:hypothetical protein BN59_01684 [Legionella massiliensis]CEE13139.1 hypothetical protein BN1094_01684 [Legionella massiliensis]